MSSQQSSFYHCPLTYSSNKDTNCCLWSVWCRLFSLLLFKFPSLPPSSSHTHRHTGEWHDLELGLLSDSNQKQLHSHLSRWPFHYLFYQLLPPLTPLSGLLLSLSMYLMLHRGCWSQPGIKHYCVFKIRPARCSVSSKMLPMGMYLTSLLKKIIFPVQLNFLFISSNSFFFFGSESGPQMALLCFVQGHICLPVDLYTLMTNLATVFCDPTHMGPPF